MINLTHVAIFFHFAACKNGTHRFEDNCYLDLEESKTFEENLDACKDKEMNLWIPGTSAEHTFISQNFDFSGDASKMLHIGILQYHSDGGWIGSDYSHHPGNPYLASLSSALGPYSKEKCLMYDVTTDTYVESTCESGRGICKQPIGNCCRHNCFLSIAIIAFF